jgi:hypothetical protein
LFVQGLVWLAVEVSSVSHSSAEMIPSVTTPSYITGHEERAVGLLQALLELNLRPPSRTLARPLEELGEFWEAEHPRIGDDGDAGGTSETLLSSAAIDAQLLYAAPSHRVCTTSGH